MTSAPLPEPARQRRVPLAQLAYASAQRGFAVQATEGDLTADETAILLAGIDRDRRTFGQELSAFPAPAEIAARHRNFTFASTAAGLATWLASPAGTDGSGRPGNVFTHAVLERQPRLSDAPRPIERWGSASWVSPFGAAAVVAATLPPAFVDDRPVVTRRTVCEFMNAPGRWRVGALCEILDALTESALPVLVSVSSPDEAAMWMGAVSFVLAPAHCERLGFSLWETPGTATRRSPRPAVVFVPEDALEADAPAGTAARIVRTGLDPALREWNEGEPSQPTRPLLGPLAAALYLEYDQRPQLTLSVLADVDTCSRELDGEHPMTWPLAIALAPQADALPGMTEPVARALLQDTPESIDDYPGLWGRGAAVVLGEYSSRVDEIQRLLAVHRTASAPVVDMLRKVLFRARLGRLLPDDPVATAVPGSRWSAWTAEDSADLVAVAMARTEGGEPVSEAVALLRIANEVAAQSLANDGSANDMSRTLMWRIATRLSPLLSDSEGSHQVIDAVTPSERSLELIVRPALANLPASASGDQPAGGGTGEPWSTPARETPRLSESVIDWLYPAPPAVDAGIPTELDVEAAAQRTSTEPESAWAIWSRQILLSYATNAEIPRNDVSDLLERAYANTELAVEDALRICQRDPSRVHAQLAFRTIGAIRAEQVPTAVRLIDALRSQRPARARWDAGSFREPDQFQTLLGATRALLVGVSGTESLSSLTVFAQEALRELSRLARISRGQLGSWAAESVVTYALIGGPEARLPIGVIVGEPISSSVVAERVRALVDAVPSDTERCQLLLEISGLAFQLSKWWPEGLGHADSRIAVLSALAGDSPETSAADLVAQSLLSGLERRDLQDFRAELLAWLVEGSEDQKALRKAGTAWFDDTTGGTGITSFFGRRSKSQDVNG